MLLPYLTTTSQPSFSLLTLVKSNWVWYSTLKHIVKTIAF